MALIYTLTSVLSAFLVFLIQPLVAKIALPTLGGIPAVWNGCMVFFQAMLLLGYLYAHLLTGRIKIRLQPWIHVGVLAVAIATFPIHFDGITGVDPVYSPLIWLMTMLLYSVGMPFFAISATAPLLQKWFSYTRHKDRENPYFLYAASNVGSMGALLLYPTLIEPFSTLVEQVKFWQVGVAGVAVLFVLLLVTRSYMCPAAEVAPVKVVQKTQPLTMNKRLYWTILSFVPSSMLYGVTAYITTDIASVPLLWIIPLALYLITFIMVFSRKPKGIKIAQELHFPLILLLLLLVVLQGNSYTEIIFVHLATFFVTALAIHGLLAENKPSTEHLTEYFLWMSVGGVLGGVFNTLVAPYIFNGITEYPLIMVLSCVVRLHKEEIGNSFKREAWHIALYGIGVTAIVYLALQLLHDRTINPVALEGSLNVAKLMVSAVAGVWGYIAYTRYKYRAAAFSLCIGLIAVFSSIMVGLAGGQNNILLEERSVFGVNKVFETSDGKVHMFMHGTTLHGIQQTTEENRLKPIAYYTQLKEVFSHVSPSIAGEPVALLGLGAGSITCYGKAGQKFDLYEIDPLVETIARNTRYFTYMQDCPPEKNVVLGDGRLNLEKAASGRYGMVVIDVFSSDSIPMHLITQEAMHIYVDKLKPDGVIAFHVSNRHLELRTILAALAQKEGLVGLQRYYTPKNANELALPSTWVVLARSKADLQSLAGLNTGWVWLPDMQDARYVWTDNYSNMLFGLRSVQAMQGIHY